MKFTDEQLNRLKEIHKKRETVVVKGVNCMGEKFETEGYITSSDINEPAVCAEYIYIEFGVSKESDNRKQTKYFAPFWAGKYQYMNLMIFELFDKDGNQIFDNSDKKEILKEAKKQNIKKTFENISEGREITEDCADPVTKKLKSMIGKAIIIDDGFGDKNEGVLLNLGEVVNSGNITIDMRKGPLVGNCFIGKHARLYTETNDGKVVLLAENMPENCDENWINEIDKIWNDRKDKIRQVQLESNTVDKILKDTTMKEQENNNDDWWQEK